MMTMRNVLKAGLGPTHKISFLCTLIGLSIVGLGVYLRFYQLDFQAYEYDELWSIGASAKGSLAEVFPILRGEGTPPTYQIILWQWIKHTGVDPTSTRSLSALFDSVGILLSFLLARRILNNISLIAFSVLISFSCFAITFAQETRTYSLLLLFAWLSTLSFTRYSLQRDVQKGDPNPAKPYTWMLVFNFCLSAIHPYGNLLALAEYLAIYLTNWKGGLKPFSIRGLVFQALTFLPTIAWYLVSPPDPKRISWIPKPDAEFFDYTFTLFLGTHYLAIAAIALGMLLLLQWSRREGDRPPERDVIFSLLGIYSFIILLPCLVSQVKPIVDERYLIVSLPSLYLFLAILTGTFSRSLTKTIGVAALLIVLFAQGSLMSVEMPWTERFKANWDRAVIAADSTIKKRHLPVYVPDKLDGWEPQEMILGRHLGPLHIIEERRPLPEEFLLMDAEHVAQDKMEAELSQRGYDCSEIGSFYHSYVIDCTRKVSKH